MSVERKGKHFIYDIEPSNASGVELPERSEIIPGVPSEGSEPWRVICWRSRGADESRLDLRIGVLREGSCFLASFFSGDVMGPK